MRVLYSFPHALGSPGIGWTAWNQVVELVAAGHQVDVLAASIARPVPGAASVQTTMTIAGRRVPHRLIGRDRAWRRHDRLVARRVEKGGVDVVHAWPLASRLTLLAARRRGVPGLREVPNTHTAHAYDVVAEELALLGLSPSQRTAHTYDGQRLALEQAEWEAATALLVPSESVRTTFTDRGWDPEVLLRHQYGHRPRAAVPVPRDADPDRPLTAVFVGRVEPRKGLHYALQAWRGSSIAERGRFLVVGEVMAEYWASLGELREARGVEVHGFVADMSSIYERADILILPSVEEGSALVTYEAQAAGCVLLVSTAAGALMTDGVEGLVHRPRDVMALTTHLDELDADRTRLARMSAAAIDHAPLLTWAAATERLTEAYTRASRLTGGAHGA